MGNCNRHLTDQPPYPFKKPICIWHDASAVSWRPPNESNEKGLKSTRGCCRSRVLYSIYAIYAIYANSEKLPELPGLQAVKFPRVSHGQY
jgi:hypothetical protein